PVGRNLYLRDLDDGDYSLLTTTGAPDPFHKPVFADASPDFEHILFESPYALTDGATDGVTNTYKWSLGSNELELVGILPSGQPVSAGAIAGSVPVPAQVQGPSPLRNTISPDGQRVVFSDLANGQLYLQDSAAPTKQISKSTRALPDPNGEQPAFFRGAT